MPDKIQVLYISYNGLLEPILPSQAVPYLEGLSRKGYHFLLLTFEKKDALRSAGRAGLKRRREALRSSGIEWHYLVYHKKPRLLATLYDLFAGSMYCLYLILSRRVSIVHVRGITPGSIMLLLSKFVNVRILFDMRGLLAEEIAAGGGWPEGGVAFRLVKRCEKALLKKADAISVLTQKHLAMNRKLDVLKGRDIPMEVVPCCVDPEKFRYDKKRAGDFRNKLMAGKDDFILMYQGKIGSFYFMDEMIDFFKAMTDSRSGSVLFIVTNDPVGHVMERCAAIGIDKRKIRIFNGVGFDDMPRYLEIADAGVFFINPQNKLGSSPIKMGEFLASGVPVIINPGVGDTEELVLDNRVGVVVRDFTQGSYMAALKELFDLKREEDKLRERCRQAARENLSLADGIERYARLYQRLSGRLR